MPFEPLDDKVAPALPSPHVKARSYRKRFNGSGEAVYHSSTGKYVMPQQTREDSEQRSQRIAEYHRRVKEDDTDEVACPEDVFTVTDTQAVEQANSFFDSIEE